MFRTYRRRGGWLWVNGCRAVAACCRQPPPAQQPRPPATGAAVTGGVNTRVFPERRGHGAELHQAGQDRGLRNGDGEAEGSAAEEREAGAQAAGGRLEDVQVARPGAAATSLYVSSSTRRSREPTTRCRTFSPRRFPPEQANELYKQYAGAYAQGQNIINLNMMLISESRCAVASGW